MGFVQVVGFWLVLQQWRGDGRRARREEPEERRWVGRGRRSSPPRVVSLQACPRMPGRLQQLHLSTSTPRFPEGSGLEQSGELSILHPLLPAPCLGCFLVSVVREDTVYPGMAAPARGRPASVGGKGCVCVGEGLLLIMCTLGRAGLVVGAQDWTREPQVPQPPAGHIIPPCLRFPRSWRHKWLSCRSLWDLVGLRELAV